MTGAPLHVVLHGHFYQPPRELPGTETVPREASAAPFHDWNQRIHEECYRAVTAARLLDAGGRVTRFVNTLEGMSFDAAPTLLRWLEREAPRTYRAFLEADRAAVDRLGHGNAMATSYHHVILPLASPSDRRAEIRWGVEDFRRRFGREPEGFWLPEAAVDLDTLEDVAAAGLRFVVLGAGQVGDLPPGGMPGRVPLPSGREMAVFAYDGGLSHGVSFGGLLRDAGAWAEALLAYRSPEGPALVSLATDGETFGHHHTFGEMALARVLERLRAEAGVRLTNFAAVLAAYPPVHAVRVVEPSSWSCPHGVERWRRECGCGAVGAEPGGQAWRAPLRRALETLGADLHAHYLERAGALLADPAGARERFGRVVDQGEAERVAFVEGEAGRRLDDGERREALEALEMQRWAQCMFTSCAWFFDDLDRVEPRIALRAAGRALALVRDEALRAHLTEGLVLTLGDARSAEGTDGAALWRAEVEDAPPAPDRVAAAVRLAREAGMAPPEAVGPWQVRLHPDGVRLRDGRTGGTVTVDAEAPQVTVDQLPHPWDVRVADALGAIPLRRWLAPGGADAVLAGRWTLETGRAHAVAGALESLPHAPAEVRDATLAWIEARLRSLAAGPGVPVPVQEALWRARRQAPDELARSLDPLFPLAGLAPPA